MLFRAAFLSGINWGLPLYLLGLYGVVRYFAKPPKPSDEAKPKVTWTPLETAGITLAIYFVSQIVGSALVYLYPLSQKWSQAQTTQWFENSVQSRFLLVLAVESLTVILLVWLLKRRHSNLRDIGLKKPDWLLSLAYIPLGFVAYFLFYVVALSVIQRFVYIDIDQQQQIGFSSAQGASLIFVFISLVLLPPIVEELLVRGFLYSGLKSKLPKIWAVLVTSALFGVAHLQAGTGEKLLWVAAIDTFVLSLVLIYLREKTGSLAAPIGLHMLKNFVAFLSIFVFHII